MDKVIVPIAESFFSKLGEKLADSAVKKWTSITNFESTLETLKRNLNLLSDKASDVEEQIKHAEQSGKKKRKREVENWLTQIKAIKTDFLKWDNEVESKGFIKKFMDGGHVAQLNERVGNLVEQSRHFGELVLDDSETRGETLLTTRMVGEAFEENFGRIWRLLETREVSSIGIYGMGGVGKTTLAKHINNRLIEKTQERVFWVTVSQAFTIKKLQDEIAKDVGVDLSDEDNEDKRAARLYRSLSQRKNILILDDVWEYINLEKVGYPVSVEGFRMIITTRSVEVCRRIGCREEIALKTLHMSEAWNLFSKTLGNETKLAPQVEEIAKRMAELCDGLPLGIITLAGSMRGETTIYVWRNALEELKEYSILGQDDMEEQVFKVLKYSFDRLDTKHWRQRQSDGYNSLQRCFLYCSLYPEDFAIPKEEVVGKFITEELMEKRKSRRAQFDQGLSILDKLVNVCLLESPQHDRVKMHDLVRAMALKITEGNTMVISGHYSLKEIPNGEKWTKDLERMSLMKNGIKRIPDGTSPNCPKLSTLLLQGNPLEFLPSRFFSKMHGLCTLDLSGTAMWKLPKSLSHLKSLKALLLKDCVYLAHVPYLGKLKALRELDLSGTNIKQVPQGIEELLNLNFLSINAKKLEMFPTELLLKFPYLQHLKFPFHIELPIEEVGSLKQLEELWGRVKNVHDFNRFIRSVKRQVNDALFKIGVGPAGYDYSFRGYKQELRLQDYDIKIDETILGEDIQHLVIKESEGLSNCLLYGILSNPKSLKRLEIAHCGGVECILKSDQFQQLKSNHQFSTLEEIWLWELRDFKGVILFYSNKREILGATTVAVPSPHPPGQLAAFASLRRLTISRCHKIRKLGLLVLSEFPNLEEISVQYCNEIEEVIEVVDDQGREEGEATGFITLPKLKVLYLSSLPILKHICKATLICSSIERITLFKCPTLKKLPLNVVPDPPPALKQIEIFKAEKEWWESMEWEDPTHPHLLQSFLRLF